ncbi:MAG: DAK2 domain-containing protein, partial [Dehalococcoidia bacterium]|nr:DAK2 domain-containing protein [Dehalococcoidia bacterium]
MAASTHLRQSAAEIDAINVYPVPDGDTGTNMSATLREAIDRAMETGEAPTVAEVLHAIARGALYGARGNS